MFDFRFGDYFSGKNIMWIIVIVFISLSAYDLIFSNQEPMDGMRRGMCNGCGNAGSGVVSGAGGPKCKQGCQCKSCMLSKVM